MAKEEPQGNDQSAELTAENERLKAEFATLKGKHDEYERLLLDPQYLDYVANGSGLVRSAKPTREVEPERSEEDAFEAMSKKELVEYIMKATRGELRQAVEPMAKTSQLQE